MKQNDFYEVDGCMDFKKEVEEENMEFLSRQEVLALAWIFGYDIEKEDEIDE